MKRPDPVLHHLIAAMLYAWSLVGVSYTWDSKSVPRWVSTSVLCYLAAIALFQALQASWRAWRGRNAVPPPSAKAPLWPTSTDDDVFEAYAADRAAKQQHAAAMAAVAAEPMQSQHIDDTADMPVAMTGVTWGFGPTGVVDAPPEPWTVPDDVAFDALVAQRSEARRGRHAVPEGLPAALQEFDWEPAGVVR